MCALVYTVLQSGVYAMAARHSARLLGIPTDTAGAVPGNQSTGG